MCPWGRAYRQRQPIPRGSSSLRGRQYSSTGGRRPNMYHQGMVRDRASRRGSKCPRRSYHQCPCLRPARARENRRRSSSSIPDRTCPAAKIDPESRSISPVHRVCTRPRRPSPLQRYTCPVRKALDCCPCPRDSNGRRDTGLKSQSWHIRGRPDKAGRWHHLSHWPAYPAGTAADWLCPQGIGNPQGTDCRMG